MSKKITTMLASVHQQGAPSTGPPVVPAAFGFESGAGVGGISPFFDLQTRNGSITYDTDRNFGNGYRSTVATDADTGSAFFRFVLDAIRKTGVGDLVYGTSITMTGKVTAGSPTVTGIASTVGLTPTPEGNGPQMSVTDNQGRLAAGTKVLKLINLTQLTLTKNALTSGTVTLTFDRPVFANHFDRAQVITRTGVEGISVDRPARPNNNYGAYTISYRINSWPKDICVPGEGVTDGIRVIEGAYQGLGSSNIGPFQIRVYDSPVGTPKMGIIFFTGVCGTSANPTGYQYNSQTPNGFNGNPVPDMTVIPAIEIGVWYEIIWEVFWSTNKDNAWTKISYRKKGNALWTVGFYMPPGIAPTVQWYSDTGYIDKGNDVVLAHRKYIASATQQSPAWELWVDSFDNGFQTAMTSLADAQKRFAS